MYNITKNMKKISILGGTFNPPHLAHIKMANIVLETFKLDSIIFIPTFIPPHKTIKNNIDITHRLEMVKLISKENKKISYSDFELQKKGISYSIETINYILDKYKNNIELYIIIGADNFKIFHTWREYTKIIEKTKIIVFQRDTSNLQNSKIKNLDKFIFYKNFNLDISSTKIREYIKNNDYRYKKYLPDCIVKYIEKNNLYK